MSVINKMLQDLDARQDGAAAASHLYAKPEAVGERGLPRLLVAGAALGVVVFAAASVVALRYWQKAHQPVAAPAPVPAKVVVMPAPPKVEPVPAAAAPVASVAEPVVVAPPAPAAAPEPAEAAPEPAKAAPEPAIAAPVKPRAHKRAQAAADKHVAAKKHGKREAAAATAEHHAKPAAGKEVAADQKAESAYRRGLASIQDGYLNDGIAALELALQANPRHDAARQTLVRVLIDNKRAEEAIGLLQGGLALEPRQPSMAMLLARLQIERGGTGVETLMRTLPYAGSNGEYHAFLAGALQRQQRHREAAEQYQVALRSGAQNGVWLMGLGISLQAERRNAEALDAFRKAKNSGNLSAELLAFVDGKIQQLAH